MKSFTTKTILRRAFFISLISLMAHVPLQATVRYVTRTNLTPPASQGDGLSWAQGTDMQKALSLAVAGDEIWIKRGTYLASASTTFTPSQYWTMKSGVKVYGGFNGVETQVSQRNPALNPVIVRANTSASSYVLSYSSANSQTLLDGVTVEGTTDITAIMINSGAPVFQNVIVRNCRNTAQSFGDGYGGGMLIRDASPIIENTVFQNDTARYKGGAIYLDNSSPSFSDVVFQNNITTNNGGGGAIYSDHSAPSFDGVIFQNNKAADDGGAVRIYYNGPNNAKASFANAVFTSNKADNGVGGAAFCEISSPSFINCSFVNNTCGSADAGGAVNTWNPAGTNPPVNSVVTNCAFWGNRNNTLSAPVASDIDTFRGARTTVTYSYFKETTAFPGTGNQASTADPFLASANPAGEDGIWFTCDDGLMPLIPASGYSIADKGSNSAATNVGLTTDIAGKIRIYDITSVANGSGGSVDMGAYENQQPNNLLSLIGTIGNSHIIPAPQEKSADFITSVTAPGAGTTISWQKRESGTNSWVAAGGLSPADSLGLRLPVITLADGQQQKTIYFRRVVRLAGCNVGYPSDSATIRVVKPNGKFYGRVVSKNGNGIISDTITVKHWPGTTVSAADIGYTYYGISDAQGYFTVANIYYGDPASGTSKDSFDVRAVKFGHNFTPPVVRKLLERDAPDNSNSPIEFKDTTVLSITGRTFQVCSGCLVTNQNCPIDSVRILKGPSMADTTFNSKTGFIDTAYGRYVAGADNPGTLVIVPQLTGHVFSPAFRSLNVQTDMNGQDFQDVTTHKISGYLRAGCGEYIGTGKLIFRDVLPKNADGTARNSCFQKEVTTRAGDGYYEITLPARKYSVSLVPGSFSNTALAVQVEAFFNDGNQVPADSLIRDISRNDTTLNLIYERPPVITIVSGLDDNITCNSTPRGFVLMEQLVPDSFRVKVLQGPPVANINGGNGCPVKDTSKVLLVTNVPSTNNTNVPAIRFATADTGVVVRLNPGSPNTIGPEYLKSINLQFTDKYGRSASMITKKVLVTGVRGDEGANFLTLPPINIPLLVLHDPPGDASYSHWENSQSTQTALRIYAAKADEENAWLEVKIGTKLETGIGVSTESEVWGTIGGDITRNATTTSSTEKLISTTYTSLLETSSSPDEVGADGDVYVGMALNMIYTTAKEVRYKNCAVSDTVTVIFANGGPPSEFRYSEKHIKTVIIPKFEYDASLLTGEKKDSVLAYAKSWEKVIENNKFNKANASGNQLISFSGGGSGSGGSTTRTKSESETVEFTTFMDKAIALAAGFEVAGSGASAGGKVTFKTEKGKSENTTNIAETTVGYILRDGTPGDSYNLNVRTDKVYGTPVFELMAGQTSCPPEPGTQVRDNIEVSAPIAVITDTVQLNPPTVEFKLFVGNNSAVTTDPSRRFKVYLDATSNPDGANVTINGTENPIEITVPRGLQQQITVRVKKDPASTVYSYRDLRIVTTDVCSSGGGDRDVSTLLSALFVSPCSNIKMTFPENGWALSGVNYIQQVQFTNYDKTKLSSVTLQYAVAGGVWQNGPILFPSEISQGSMAINWTTLGLADGNYKLRLKLVCSSGVVYSETASGIIDRVAPQLYGQPTPTDDNYVNGDIISFSYTKKLNTANLNTGKVTMTRIGNNTDVPVTVTGYENRIVIVPVSSISSYVGETIRVIVKDISDEYGNVKATPDTSYFLVGTTTVATGTNALTVSITTPVVYKNSDSVISIRFKRPIADTNDVHVNYTISGTARLGIDYTIAYDSIQPSYAYHNGAQGAISIGKNTLSKVLRIIPVSDTAFAADKTITISLSQSGDYGLGVITAATGTISSLDSNMSVYTFTGNGSFNVKSNWANNRMPLTRLTSGRIVYINPSGTCTLNGPLTLMPGSMLRVQQNKTFIVQGKINQP